MTTEAEQLGGYRLEPRKSASGKAFFWFWDELPPHIKTALSPQNGFQYDEVGPEAKFSYTVKSNSSGSFTVFRNYIKKTDPATQKFRRETRASLEGTSGGNTEDKWDKIRARNEERDKAFEKRHQDSMDKMDDLIGILRVVDEGNRNTLSTNIVNLTRAILELTRVIVEAQKGKGPQEE